MAYENILSNLKETAPRSLNDHILVIDAMNMLIRSFSLLKAMNPSGSHIGGIVGFLRSLGYVTRIFDPTRVIIVWDGKGGSANRKNVDPNYKAQRATSRITHWGLYDTKAARNGSFNRSIAKSTGLFGMSSNAIYDAREIRSR